MLPATMMGGMSPVGSNFSQTGMPDITGRGYSYLPGSDMALFVDGLNNTMLQAAKIADVSGMGLSPQSTPMGGGLPATLSANSMGGLGTGGIASGMGNSTGMITFILGQLFLSLLSGFQQKQAGI